MHFTIKVTALVLTFTASLNAEDVAPSFPGNAVPPKITSVPGRHQGNAVEEAEPLTIHVTNSFGSGLYVSFGHNSGSPTAINHPQNGPLGTATQGVYPTKWAGRIAVGKDPDPAIIGRGSLIEASYDTLLGVYIPYVDVSYVQGYTIPITCSCAGKVVTGCNKPLFNDGIQCPNEGPGPICFNPLNNSTQQEGTLANPFFEPCQGAAFTYPNDFNSGAYCETSRINCCIGSTCPSDPKQHSKRQAIGGHEARVPANSI